MIGCWSHWVHSHHHWLWTLPRMQHGVVLTASVNWPRLRSHLHTSVICLCFHRNPGCSGLMDVSPPVWPQWTWSVWTSAGNRQDSKPGLKWNHEINQCFGFFLLLLLFNFWMCWHQSRKLYILFILILSEKLFITWWNISSLFVVYKREKWAWF